VTSAPPEKKEPDEDSLKKKLPPGHVAAQVASTLVCAFAMSFLGTAGTLAGLATGSLLSSTVPTLIEHTAGRSAKRTRERYLHYRSKGLSPETAHRLATGQMKPALTRKDGRRHRNRRLKWTAVTAALVAAVSLAGLTSIEAAAGKPASAIVQGRTGSGTTLGGSSYTPPSPVPSYSPSFTPTVSYTTAAASPSISPSALPSLSSSPSPSLSPSPSPSTSPSQTPSLSPSASPSPSGTPSSAQVPAGTQEPSPGATENP
jgi:hypothetical protein